MSLIARAFYLECDRLRSFVIVPESVANMTGIGVFTGCSPTGSGCPPGW
jgi:hypothetical protein